MSSGIQTSSLSTPHFQPIFEKALKEYKKKTGKDLTAHPLAAEIKACDSPEDILAVLEGKANELSQSRSGDERLSQWLNPTVNILNALSATLGEGTGSVFPPTKIIFSGISVLLVAAKDTVASRDVLVELFDRIRSFFERLKIYTEGPSTQAVTDVLVKNMAEVLSIVAIATKGMKERPTKTFLKKLAGMNDIEDSLQRLRQMEQGELLTVTAQTSSDGQKTKGIVEEILNKMNSRDFEEVLYKLKGWLSPPDPSTNYNIGLRDLHKETATWFLEGSIFQEWHSTGSLLWIHGKPGSGKSILCSAIIQRILSLCNGGRAFVAYFYFDFRDENKKHRHDLLPSMLVQLAAHSIPCCEIISRIYSAHGKGTRRPSDEVLINCLTDVLSATTQQPTYIIVDALDECPNTSGVRSPREWVLRLIQDLVGLRLRNLHICVTSRPEVDIRNRLEPLRPFLVSLHDQPGQKEDIAKYIRSEVDFIANDKRWRDDDKGLVIETLSEKADGMFRWVFCQLEVLRLCLRSRVRQLVNELPDSLDETYERVLKEIHKTNQAHVERLLQCLAVAILPLRVKELAEILTFDSDAIEGEVPTLDADSRSEDQEQELLSACPSLITIVDSNGSRVVQFSHFSVKEFLTSDRLSGLSDDISRYRILPNDAHTTLARALLHALLRLDDRLDDGIGWWSARRFPLAEYAAGHWFFHVQVGNVSSRVMGLMKTLFDLDKPHLASWIRMYNNEYEPSVWSPNPLYYSALFGLYDLVEHLVKKHSRHVNAVGGEEYYYPLAAALHGEHIQVAELLIQYGAKVDIQEPINLMRIVVGWPDNLAVGAVRFLLKHDADVNFREEDNTTLLHLASKLLRLELVRFLAEHGTNINAKDDQGQTPLHEALQSYFGNNEDRFGVAQLLIGGGADVNVQGEDYTTPLHSACDKPYLESVRLLVERGANVNARNSRGQIPLHLACDKLDLETVLLLVKYGANVSAKGERGQTPLHQALLSDRDSEDRFGVARLLVERGADVDAQDEDHTTPLHVACNKLRLESVRLLAEHGANVNAKNKWGQTPLHQALLSISIDNSGGRSRVAQLLAECGADVNARDDARTTPLHLASRFLDLKSVQTLLDHGANSNAEDGHGRTPLHRVLDDGYSDGYGFRVAQLLMERGADVNTRDNNHETPLHLASRLVSLKVAWILLEHGVDLNAENKEGKIPFQLVQESIREDMKRSPSEYSIGRARRAQGIALMGLLYGY